MTGRPTNNQLEKIRKTICELYVSGLSATQIIATTGHNKDTVYKHLKKFQKERQSDPTFNQNLSIIVEHARLALDKRIAKNLQEESEIEKMIKNSRIPPKHLLSLRLKLSQHVLDMLDKKFSYEIQVGADDMQYRNSI